MKALSLMVVSVCLLTVILGVSFFAYSRLTSEKVETYAYLVVFAANGGVAGYARLDPAVTYQKFKLAMREMDAGSIEIKVPQGNSKPFEINYFDSEQNLIFSKLVEITPNRRSLHHSNEISIIVYSGESEMNIDKLREWFASDEYKHLVTKEG